MKKKKKLKKCMTFIVSYPWWHENICCCGAHNDFKGEEEAEKERKKERKTERTQCCPLFIGKTKNK